MWVSLIPGGRVVRGSFKVDPCYVAGSPSQLERCEALSHNHEQQQRSQYVGAGEQAQRLAHLLLLQGTWVGFKAFTWRLTAGCNSISPESDALF